MRLNVSTESLVLDKDQVELILRVTGNINDIERYSIDTQIQNIIIDKIVTDWLAKNASDVISKIDVAGIVNLVSLKAARIIRE